MLQTANQELLTRYECYTGGDEITHTASVRSSQPRFQRQPNELLSDKIRTLDLPRPLSVASGTSVRQVIQTVQRRSAGCVLVVEDDRVVGIMTERDVLMKVVARDVDYDDPVDNFMTKDPFTLTPDATIGEAITLMDRESFRNVPIVDNDGKAIAIFRIQDVVNFLAESFPEQVLNLPPRPHQLMKTPEGA